MNLPPPSTITPIQFHGTHALALTGPQGAAAIVSLQGAQVLSWIPAGGQEWLYLSETSDFSGRTAIRGGVPVCFPQFSSKGALPKHGLVRCVPWQLLGQHADDTAASVTLGLGDSVETRELWPHKFSIKLTARLSAHELKIGFEVENTGEQAFSFTVALHTYLRIGDVGTIQIDGLGGVAYRDAANGNVEVTQAEPLLRIDGEVDRVYHMAPNLLRIRDAKRTLAIQSQGFPETVIWNPGPEKCAALNDMPEDGYRNMICVEAACADASIELVPGQHWRGSQRLISSR